MELERFVDIAQLINNESETHEAEWQGLTVAFRWHPGRWTNEAAPKFVSGDSEVFIEYLTEFLAWWDLTEVVPPARGEKPDPNKTRPVEITVDNVKRLPIPVLNKMARMILEDVTGQSSDPNSSVASQPTSSVEESSESAPDGTAS